MVSQLPLIGPNRRSAVMAYAEHDGVNRQLGGNIGEMNR